MKEFSQILFAEIISVTGGILAGFILAFNIAYLEIIPGLLILIPGFLGMLGGIFGSLSSRLSSGLNLGSIEAKLKPQPFLNSNIIATLILITIISIFLGLLGMLVNFIIFKVFNLSILFISILGMLISSGIELPLVILTTFWLFNHNLDPDNIMGPYITTLGDFVGILSLLIATLVVL